MNSFEEETYLNRLYEELNTSHGVLMNDLKNDKECTKEKVLTGKLQCIDVMRRALLKYRNIRTKDKLKGDL